MLVIVLTPAITDQHSQPVCVHETPSAGMANAVTYSICTFPFRKDARRAWVIDGTASA